VLGVDPSTAMIDFAREHFLADHANLRFEVGDAKAWDFGSRAAFADFGEVTFVEWTRRIPAIERREFVADLLDRYQRLGDRSAADAAVFHFYRMKVVLRCA
jgi:hypothetical protein